MNRYTPLFITASLLLATVAVALPDLDLETAAGAVVKDATTQGRGDARRAPGAQEAKP
jgi:hypothetical protein